MAPLVALCTGGVDVRLDLGFEGAGEHPPRSLSGDLVEIEHEPFADFIVLMYPFHRCASSSSKSLEKVHHALQGILDPQLLSISLPRDALERTYDNGHVESYESQDFG